MDLVIDNLKCRLKSSFVTKRPYLGKTVNFASIFSFGVGVNFDEF